MARFIAFRVFFNARFYYPVIAVMFVDYGLTLAQYAILNVAWAAAIVTLEVPSGALADRLGRRRMVVAAASLMVFEMCLLVFAPAHSFWLFPVMLLNRITSGAAEASASGADEALAYDSLTAAGRAAEWPAVLARLMRWQSVAFFVAMIAGGAVYDASLVESAGRVLGFTGTVADSATLRLPAILTLGMSAGALIAAIGMREPETHEAPPGETAWKTIAAAGRWILQSRNVLLTLAAGVACDVIVRLFLTMCSEYYRLIAVPEYAFGLIGAGMAVIGFVVPPAARRLVERKGPALNFGLAAILIVAGLAGIAAQVPRLGLLFLVPLQTGMVLAAFFLSHYLNALVPANVRATVLSFRGLAMNVAFGAMSLGFAGLLRSLREPGGDTSAAFSESLIWLPWTFTILAAAVVLAATRKSGPEG